MNMVNGILCARQNLYQVDYVMNEKSYEAAVQFVFIFCYALRGSVLSYELRCLIRICDRFCNEFLALSIHVFVFGHLLNYVL